MNKEKKGKMLREAYIKRWGNKEEMIDRDLEAEDKLNDKGG